MTLVNACNIQCNKSICKHATDTKKPETSETKISKCIIHRLSHGAVLYLVEQASKLFILVDTILVHSQ